MTNLEKLTSLLWGCEIRTYNFNLENHAITMEVRRVYDKEETLFNVILDEVCSFSWINDMDEDRKKLFKWEYLDLVSFDTVTNTKINILGDDFLNRYTQTPNVCLEIGNSVLLIEANSIIINNEKFQLNAI